MSFTVTATASGTGSTNGATMQVLVLTNAVEAGGGSGVFSNQGTAATVDASVTPAASSSLVVFGLQAYPTTPAVATNNAYYPGGVYDDTGDGSFYVAGHYSGTVTAGTPVTVGSSTSGQYSSVAAYEIKGVSGAPVLDGSTPAWVTAQSSQAATSAAFTPPAGAVLAAVVIMDGDDSGSIAVAMSDTSGLGLTWTQRAIATTGTAGSQAVVYTATVPSGNHLSGGPSMASAQLSGTVNNPVNLLSDSISMALAQLAGTLNNPVNLLSDTWSMAPAQIAGTVNNLGLSNHLTGGPSMASAQVAGTLNNPVNLTGDSISMAPMQLSGEVELGHNILSSNLPMSPVQLAGELNNPVNLTSDAISMASMQLAGEIATQHNLSTPSGLSMAPMQLSGSVGAGGESLFINGVSIMNCAAQFVADLSGILFVPLVRTADIAVPGRQGLVRVPRKLYDRAQIPMTIWVRGMNPDNTYPPLAERDALFYKNLDALMQMFAVSGIVTMVHTTPAGTVRQITGQVLQAFTPVRYAWSAQSTGNLQVIIECTGVFWREPSSSVNTLAASSSPLTAPLTAFDGSTAPIEDAVVVFEGPCVDPMIATADGWFVQIQDTLTSGQSVTIDCGAWTITGGGGYTVNYAKLVHAGLGPWLVVNPLPLGSPMQATYSYSGGGASTCTVTAERSFLAG